MFQAVVLYFIQNAGWGSLTMANKKVRPKIENSVIMT